MCKLILIFMLEAIMRIIHVADHADKTAAVQDSGDDQ